jgi:SAM-dependent methyltransferase
VNSLDNDIVRANLDVHEKEARFYDQLHQEITNLYQRYRLQKFLKLIVNQLPDSKPPYILEIGSGTGFLTLQLLKFGFFVHAVELSPKMVEILESKISSSNFRQKCKIFNSDINSFLDYELDRDKYQLICMNSVLHHFPDYLKTFDKLLQFVDYKGILFISHEPLPPPSLNFFYRNIHRLDMKIRSSLLPKKLKKVAANIDYSLADFHTQLGISPDHIVKLAEDKDFRCLILQKYCGQLKTGFLSLIANSCSVGKDHFRLAIQKSKIK